MAARAQDRQYQYRADQRSGYTTGEDHQQMRQWSARGQNRSAVAAYAEESGTGEIGDAGVPELNGQSQACGRIERNRRQHQQCKVGFVQSPGNRQDRGDGEAQRKCPVSGRGFLYASAHAGFFHYQQSRHDAYCQRYHFPLGFDFQKEQSHDRTYGNTENYTEHRLRRFRHN